MSSRSPYSRRALLAALAERLRHGPLHAMHTLHDRATAIAADNSADMTRQIEQLGELVRLAQIAMDRFQTFTIELKVLVFEMAESPEQH